MAAATAAGSAVTTWVEVPADCDWTIHNIPFGIFSPSAGGKPRPGTIIGTTVRVSAGTGRSTSPLHRAVFRHRLWILLPWLRLACLMPLMLRR